MGTVGKTVGALVVAALMIVPGFGNTSETGNSPDRAEVAQVTRTSRERVEPTPTAPSRQQVTITTGEWNFEGPSMLDKVAVVIDDDWYGIGPKFIDEYDPQQTAVEIGAPLIGEAYAPEGCRKFTYSGPMGVPIYHALCSGHGYMFIGVATDGAVLDMLMADFMAGEGVTAPAGYRRTFG